MKVWVVPYAYGGSLRGVGVFDSQEKAQDFWDTLQTKHSKKERLDLFIRNVKVK